MTFPDVPLDIAAEVAFGADLTNPGSWAYTDVTPDVRAGLVVRRGRQDEGQGRPAPAGCVFELDNPGGIYTPYHPLSPHYPGVLPDVPLRVKAAGSVRGVLSVAEWAPGFADGGGGPWEDAPVCAVDGAGLLRRLGQGAVPLRSAIRRAYEAAGVLAYWPMEDGTDSTQLASAISGHPTAVPAVNASISSDDTLGGSLPLPVIRENLPSRLGIGLSIPAVSLTGQWQVEFFLNVPTTITGSEIVLVSVFASGTTPHWRVNLLNGPSTKELQIYRIDADGVQIDSVVLAAPDFLGGWAHCSLHAQQSGGNVTWGFTYAPASPAATAFHSVSGTTFAGTLGRPTAGLVWADLGTAVVGVGHIGVFDTYSSTTHWPADDGYFGETAADRFTRICAEEGIAAQVVGTAADSEPMNSQPAATLVALLGDVETTDGGMLYETRDALGLTYRTRSSRYNAPVGLALQKVHLAPSFRPTADDQVTRNDITVVRRDGSSARFVDAEHIARHGRYDESVTVDVSDEARLGPHAMWRGHLGTVEEIRYPRITLYLHADPDLIPAWLACDIGSRVTIAQAPASLPPGEIDLVIDGYTETLDALEWTVELVCSPASPWQVGVYDTDRYGTDGSTLAVAVDSDDTTLQVRPGDRRWTTDTGDFTPDLRLNVGGEQIDVSAISNAAAFVGVGTAVHGDNASLNPTKHASTAPGDVMLLLAAIRNTGAIPNTPTGWNLLLSGGNVRVFSRTATGGANDAPTVSFTSGVAGDSTSAQIATFRGVLETLADSNNGQSNPSAQNIAFNALSVEDDCAVVIWVGWKQDDWTSVTSPGTEIGEPSTTLGNDQGIVWSYEIQVDRDPTQPDSFVVTGGAAAISRGMVLTLPGLQTMTVSARSVNGVVKSHTVGTEIRLGKDAVYAL